MTSDSDVKIPIEEAPDKNKILKIVCSPNMKHVATLDEIKNNISFWSTNNQEQRLKKVRTIHIDNMLTNKNFEKIFAISDNMLCSIMINRIAPYNFKIFEVESEQEILLTFPDWQNEIHTLRFIDNGNIVMVSTKYCRTYVFSTKDSIIWVCKSMIELKYFSEIWITSTGKLIIFNDTIYEIIIWDIEDLSIKTNILIDWNYTLNKYIEISDDEKLLIVCAKNEETNLTRLYVFSTETGINLGFIDTKLKIDRLHLIASSKGERLLYSYVDFSGKYRFNLNDPYGLKNPINASKLFENKQIQEPYIIKSDKIIYTFDGEFNSHIKNQLDILPSFKNDDFFTFTRIGIIIWTYRYAEIKTNYYWNEYNHRLNDFDLEDTKFEDLLNLFKGWTSRRILPASSYETIYKNLNIEFGNKRIFEEFLKDNILEELYLIFYGKILMKMFIRLRDHKLIQLLGMSCINKCVSDSNHLISKISLLSVIFENFNDLSENHPTFIASILSLIGFVIPLPFEIPDSISSHLSTYGSFHQLSKTSYLDILTSILWNHWISFQENFRIGHIFRDLVVKPAIKFCYMSHSSTILAIPLPNFVSYPKEYNFWKELLFPKPNSFTCSNKIKLINEEFYRYLNGEALLKFKWNTYGRKYYLAIWAIYTVYLLNFVIAATYYKNISQTSLVILLNTTIFLGIWHLFFELRQFIFSPLTYIFSVWNFFDLSAYLLPMVSAIIWIRNNDMPTKMATFSTLLLEIKFLLYFRAIEFSSIYFSMMLGVAQGAFSFLVIIGFIIFAFAHSLHILLRYSTPNGTNEEISSLGEQTTNMFMMMDGLSNFGCLSYAYWRYNTNF
ncbi:transient receptor potential cation channel subfamily a member 1-like [Gigaspora margarita]|uniref:Transient receptor potential cation channel subfamily a member 1-like n=1 Tax=Gigaspora margarita TaxID=4874 RepID=A0A8H4AKU2_GIGMA|nr:transient receptor potential cation channel subfamily a member 1-like [Gigaspora margarita]